jgi:hypothetical protein
LKRQLLEIGIDEKKFMNALSDNHDVALTRPRKMASFEIGNKMKLLRSMMSEDEKKKMPSKVTNVDSLPRSLDELTRSGADDSNSEANEMRLDEFVVPKTFTMPHESVSMTKSLNTIMAGTSMTGFESTNSSTSLDALSTPRSCPATPIVRRHDDVFSLDSSPSKVGGGVFAYKAVAKAKKPRTSPTAQKTKFSSLDMSAFSPSK